MTSHDIKGIHHVTAIASSAQKTVDFYAGVLGLRIVKKTVNFDDSSVYHLYFGDEAGSPGSILTFFPYEGLVGGRRGKGMLNTIAFSVPLSSVNFWMERLKKFNISYRPPRERFAEETFIYLEDTDGLGLELTFNDKDERKGYATENISGENAIKGFYSIEIWEEGYELTRALLTGQLNHQLISEKGNRFRFAVNDDPGNYVDILCMPGSLRGLRGSGTVHHLAFATPDETTQRDVREKIKDSGLNITPVLDRKYFKSVYFREPGGVLFEVATISPGFTIDEPEAQLGKRLMLPNWLEKERFSLEKELVPIHLDLSKYR